MFKLAAIFDYAFDQTSGPGKYPPSCSEIFGSPTGQKVKANMAGMEALSFSFSPPARSLRDT